MLLTISTTHSPATDLGFLLHKHPDHVRSVDLPFGEAHVFFPEASGERCTAALLVEVDPIGLIRKGRGAGDHGFSLSGYVNDRPYAASSFLSVALGRAFRTAMNRRSKDRPELVDAVLPLEVSQDKFVGERFDYLLANPPFGVEWKKVQQQVKDEAKQLGFGGRFLVPTSQHRTSPDGSSNSSALRSRWIPTSTLLGSRAGSKRPHGRPAAS